MFVCVLKELENLKKENGHSCCVPGLHTKDSETYPLACWVARHMKLVSINSSITSEKIPAASDSLFNRTVANAALAWPPPPNFSSSFPSLTDFHVHAGLDTANDNQRRRLFGGLHILGVLGKGNEFFKINLAISIRVHGVH
jgi:hypothetical protein